MLYNTPKWRVSSAPLWLAGMLLGASAQSKAVEGTEPVALAALISNAEDVSVVGVFNSRLKGHFGQYSGVFERPVMVNGRAASSGGTKC